VIRCRAIDQSSDEIVGEDPALPSHSRGRDMEMEMEMKMEMKTFSTSISRVY